VAAQKLYEEAKTEGRRVKGPVDSRHAFIDMTNVSVALENGASVRTCKPAMGFSFAAGTTDGPGAFDFRQGDAHVSV
jgi:neutral ceramidase